MLTSRRKFIASSIVASAGLAFGIQARRIQGAANPPYSINIFSKNLQWLNYTDMSNLTAEMGFDGIDLTVRPNGHVEPARVEEDLPKAIDAARKAGIQVPMITTAILSAWDPLTEKIIKIAAGLGVTSYRMGWMSYDEKMSIDQNLTKFESEFKSLEGLNKKYNIRGEYQNHSGAYLGSAVWDVVGILKRCDPAWIGLQYDVLHATVEGANAWPQGVKHASTHVTSMPIKDFQWSKKDGKWLTEVVPLGEGAVDLKKYLGLIKSLNIKGPFSMHFEYPLGGVENGTKTLTIDKSIVVAAMTRDLGKFRNMLKEAGIRS